MVNSDSRRQFLRLALAVGATIALGTGVVYHLTRGGGDIGDKSEAEWHRREANVVIHGTGSYDVDAMQVSSREYKLRETRDIFWQQITKSDRTLTPMNGAEIALLDRKLEDVFVEDLIQAPYDRFRVRNPREAGIWGSDDNNQLTPGTVVAIKTAQGKYAALRVNGYVPLQLGDRERTVIENYNMKCTVVVYQKANIQ